MADLISINRFKLDEEWAEQPRSHHKLCLDAADAKLKVAESKAELELVEAELDHEIRLHPSRFGVEDGRLTEKVVANAVLRSKRYQEAQATYLRARHALDVMEAAVSASEHKKKALESEVQLFLSGYFANPRAKGDVKSEMDERKRKKLYEKIQNRNPDA
jgi:hypothetical protein